MRQIDVELEQRLRCGNLGDEPYDVESAARKRSIRTTRGKGRQTALDPFNTTIYDRVSWRSGEGGERSSPRKACHVTNRGFANPVHNGLDDIEVRAKLCIIKIAANRRPPGTKWRFSKHSISRRRKTHKMDIPLIRQS